MAQNLDRFVKALEAEVLTAAFRKQIDKKILHTRQDVSYSYEKLGYYTVRHRISSSRLRWITTVNKTPKDSMKNESTTSNCKALAQGFMCLHQEEIWQKVVELRYLESSTISKILCLLSLTARELYDLHLCLGMGQELGVSMEVSQFD
jgi:hypothetical protein